MCRYAFNPYRAHYACFTCRKTFKATDRQVNDLEKPCPQCGSAMTRMGLDFKAPQQQDKRRWRKAEYLAAYGFTFASCGCGGPGYAPKTLGEAHELVRRHLGEPEGVRLLREFTQRHSR